MQYYIITNKKILVIMISVNNNDENTCENSKALQ